MSWRRPLRIHRRFARSGREGPVGPPCRLAALPRGPVGGPDAPFGGLDVPVATRFRARLLGLALLDPADAGPGLLIPHCSAVHTFGMKFALDIYFLDQGGTVLEVRRAVPPRRFVAFRGAAAVLEIPA